MLIDSSDYVGQVIVLLIEKLCSSKNFIILVAAQMGFLVTYIAEHNWHQESLNAIPEVNTMNQARFSSLLVEVIVLHGVVDLAY